MRTVRSPSSGRMTRQAVHWTERCRTPAKTDRHLTVPVIPAVLAFKSVQHGKLARLNGIRGGLVDRRYEVELRGLRRGRPVPRRRRGEPGSPWHGHCIR